VLFIADFRKLKILGWCGITSIPYFMKIYQLFRTSRGKHRHAEMV
jgi:hypothetical protein